MAHSTITSIPPELTGILASYLPREESEQSVKLFDPNGTYDENTYHELCKAHHRVSIKPQNISWKEHYHNCENGFYERVKRAYGDGYEWYIANSRTIQSGVEIGFSATLLTGTAIFIPGASTAMLIGAGLGAVLGGIKGFRDYRNYWNESVLSRILKGSVKGAIIGGCAGSIYSITAVHPVLASTITTGMTGALEINNYEEGNSLIGSVVRVSVVSALTYVNGYIGAIISGLFFYDLSDTDFLVIRDYRYLGVGGLFDAPISKVCGKIAGVFNWLKTCITG